MNIIPKTTEVEITEKYFNGHISPTMTGTPHYYWEGRKTIKWLWFTFKRKYNKFEVKDSMITFDKSVREGTKIKVSYYKLDRV